MLDEFLSRAISGGMHTDLYHPDAAYVAWRTRRIGITTFDLYTRRAPCDGAFLLVAGLEFALDFIREFQYEEKGLRYLTQIRDYDPNFVDYLRHIRFTGDVLAMPEGTVAFPGEPLIRVTAPFIEGLLIEAGLLQAINTSTWVATKAARTVLAANGRRVSEFAFRRAAAPFTVARSAYIGGCASTSFVAAAERFRIPATGTIPHALVQLFPDETEAFMAVAETYNRYTVLLDTYDVTKAISKVIKVAHDVEERLGHHLAAVRLDSGNLDAASRHVRHALDAANLYRTRIIASGDLDEFSIQTLVRADAPIDGFGVGTSLGVATASSTNPGGLGGVYKAVHYVEEDGTPTPLIKLAENKTTWPGRKEVYRIGAFDHDVVQLEGEQPPSGSKRLLRPVILSGSVVSGSSPPLSEVREFAQQNLSELPEQYRHLSPTTEYPVVPSASLDRLRSMAMDAHQPGATSTI